MGNKKYKVGYTCGVFDLFHYGHLNLLEKCKDLCEILIVGVCDDDYVVNIKNKTPIFNQEERARILQALEVVDKTVIVDTETVNDKILAQEQIGFDVLFSGDDWKGSERYLKTEKQFEKTGTSIEYFPYTQGISTSLIIEILQENRIKKLKSKNKI